MTRVHLFPFSGSIFSVRSADYCPFLACTFPRFNTEISPCNLCGRDIIAFLTAGWWFRRKREREVIVNLIWGDSGSQAALQGHKRKSGVLHEMEL